MHKTGPSKVDYFKAQKVSKNVAKLRLFRGLEFDFLYRIRNIFVYDL